jgi:hypothetical protein
MKRVRFIGRSEELAPGIIFSYRAPESSDSSPRKAAAGQILGLEGDRGIVHVRLFDRVDEGLRVFIGHVPVAFDALCRSAARIVAEAAAPEDWRETYQAWSERRAHGDVAAFDMPLDEVAKRALEAVTESMDAVAPGSVTLRWVFPKRGASGGFNIIEAAIVLPGSADAIVEDGGWRD